MSENTFSETITKEDKLRFVEHFALLEKEFKEYEKFYNQYKALQNSYHFKTVILKGYLQDEAVRLVQNKNIFKKQANTNTIEWAKIQDELTEQAITSISYFQEYLDKIEFNYQRLLEDYNRAKAIQIEYIADISNNNKITTTIAE